jgi:hypothetical protein
LRKLKPEDIQEGRVFHNGERSVRVLRTEVVFQDLGNWAKEKRLPMSDFCARFKRRKG